MDAFRSGKLQLLIASDIAARGLDIEGITHVFNLDMPENPKGYLHRVGRTGRKGNGGVAVSIITEREYALLKAVEKAYKISIQPKDMYMGNIVEPRRKVKTFGKAAAPRKSNAVRQRSPRVENRKG